MSVSASPDVEDSRILDTLIDQSVSMLALACRLLLQVWGKIVCINVEPKNKRRNPPMLVIKVSFPEADIKHLQLLTFIY